MGRAYICKDCARMNDRDRNKIPDRRAYIRNWEKTEKGRRLRALSRQLDRNNNRQKYRARRILSKLIKDGLIIRMPCEKCGEVASEGHHPDYTKPIAVIWLCPKHHSELHRLTTE